MSVPIQSPTLSEYDCSSSSWCSLGLAQNKPRHYYWLLTKSGGGIFLKQVYLNNTIPIASLVLTCPVLLTSFHSKTPLCEQLRNVPLPYHWNVLLLVHSHPLCLAVTTTDMLYNFAQPLKDFYYTGELQWTLDNEDVPC